MVVLNLSAPWPFLFWKPCAGLQLNAVDGRNPAPVDVVDILVFICHRVLFIHPRWCRVCSINCRSDRSLGNSYNGHDSLFRRSPVAQPFVAKVRTPKRGRYESRWEDGKLNMHPNNDI